ncbi:PAS domain S-box protein [Flammeovirgaceae bacterium SG7u.111]|nr:PAS domain S-box protein [Flammeovirgaceae bacterium SG7u.132]WPO37220.1 PAS domain S-box protein [Flammeovirgaceae bacterium SG7u.111]
MSFQKIIGEIDDYAILLLNTEGIIENWNSGAEKIKGYTADEIIGKSFTNFYSKKDQEDQKPQKLLEKAFTQGKASDEGWRVRKNGSSFWASTTITAVHDDDGKVVGFTKVTRDLTLFKAEEHLTKVNNRFKVATEAARIGIWDWDIITNKIIWDDIMFEIYQVNKASFTGSFSDWEARAHPEDLERIKQEIMFAIENKKVYNTEFRIICPDKSIRYIKASGGVQFDLEGNPIRMVGSNWDISPQKYAEIQTTASKEKYKALIDNSPNACFLSTLEGNFLDANPVACDMFGYTQEEFKSLQLIQIVDTGDQRVSKYIRQLKREGRVKGDIIGIRKNNHRFLLEVAAVLYKDTISGKERVNLVMTDISDRKKIDRLFNDTNQLARVGGWEIDMLNNTIYWSEVTKEIHEVAVDFEPSLETAINFYKVGKSRELISNAVNECVTNATPFDLELQIITANGKEKWVRAMGKAEFIDGKVIRIFGAFQDIDEKRLIIQQLEKSKQEYQSLFSQNPDAVYALDREGHLLSFNEKLSALSETPAEKLKTMTFTSFCAPEDLDRVMGHFDEVWEGKPQNYELGIITSKGNKLALNMTNMPIVVDGNIIGVYSIAKDITELKTADFELKQSRENLQKIMDHSLDIICTINKEGEFVQVSAASKQILGYTPEELIGIPFINLVYKEDQAITEKEAKNIIAGTATTNFENRYVRKDGKLVPIIWSVIWDNNDELFYSIAKDASATKKAESLLMESEKKVKDLARNVPGVVFQMCVEKDGNTYFTHVSDKMEEIFGFSSSITPQEWSAQIPEGEREDFYSSTAKTIADLSDWDYEGRIICGNGNIKWFQGKSVPLKVDDNIILNGIMLDITKRKKVELEREHLIQELSKNNTELKQFSYITSHNLRAPITNLIGIHNLLDTTKIEDKKTQMLIDGLSSSTKQLNETLNDLINILIIKENTNLDPESVGVAASLKRVTSSISSFIEQSETEINTDFEEIDKVQFNKEYLDSILLNLITNSIKYAHPERQPKIVIRTRKKAGKVQLTVQDNGLGLNMEKVKGKIFGLYQRFHNHANSKGIGLYLVHSQVTSLGGTIEVASEENIGSTFIITFK